MVALNFQQQFAHDVEAGIKAQTIRRHGKRKPPKVGDELQLYTGMRTKSCRLLRRVTCTSVVKITIDTANRYVSMYLHNGTDYEWIPITQGALTVLFVDDGFNSVEEFCDFFATDADPVFLGYLIKWGI